LDWARNVRRGTIEALCRVGLGESALTERTFDTCPCPCDRPGAMPCVFAFFVL